MPDPLFTLPRLASIYDAIDGDRTDLAPYLALVDELDAKSVLDIGCGTGTFACLLAGRGIAVTGVDPAQASLDVARRKAHAEDVRWVLGTVSSLPPLTADLATMTGNVAQVFLEDEEWAEVLHGVHAALRSRGHLVFETRDPERRPWELWSTNDPSRVTIPGIGLVEHWIEVVDVSLPFVSFTETFRFASDGAILRSDSTLRFRTEGEIVMSLSEAGFSVIDVRDAPDRPQQELVFIAARP